MMRLKEKKAKPWNIFAIEAMSNLVELETILRRLNEEARDAHLNVPKSADQQDQKELLASMCSVIGVVQEKLADAIKAFFQLDLAERDCDAFVKFQLANGIWESDFLNNERR